MFEMLEEEFFKMKICVVIIVDCKIFRFRSDLSIYIDWIVLIINDLL